MGVTDFIKRHRRKLFVALGISASIYWAIGYVGDKLRELQEKLILDRLTREDLERRFEQNQKDATFTTMSLLPTVSVQILDEYNVEETRRTLQELRGTDQASSQELANSITSNSSLEGSTLSSKIEGSVEGSFVVPPSKASLWNKIKVESLTRAVLLVYTAALITVLTRIQLNILGRKSYADSVKRATSESESVNDVLILSEDEEHTDAVNRQFLTFSWWLLHRGWKLLSQRVKQTVEDVCSDVEPTQRLTFQGFADLIGKIHKQIDEQGGFTDVLLPPVELETFVLGQIPGEEIQDIDAQLRSALDETKDIAASPSCVEVIQRLVHNGITVLMSKLVPVFETETGEARLAMALMQTAKQAQHMAAGSPLSNEYLESMVQVPALDALSAAIYSNY